MSKTALVTTEKKHAKPILIIDKFGSLGKSLSTKLKNEFLIVFVSKIEAQSEENVVFVPFQKKAPTIPDNIYSHIILIADKETTKNIVKTFAKKAVKDNSSFSLILNGQIEDTSLAKEALKYDERTKVIILGEIFSQDFLFDKESDIGKLIFQAKNFGKIKISNDGSREQSPVFLEDAVEAILESIFVEEKVKLFYIFPQNKTTLLSIALMLKKKYPNLRLDFVKEKSEIIKTKPIAEGGKYMLDDSYNFEEKIKKVSLEKIIKEESDINKKERKLKFSFAPIIVFLISLSVLPLLSTLFFLFLGKGFYALGEENLYLSSKSFEATDISYSILARQLEVFRAEGNTAFLEKQIAIERKNSEITFLLSDFLKKTQNLLFSDLKDPRQEFEKAVLEIKRAYLLYEDEKQKTSISEDFARFLNITSATIEFWPNIFGFNGERNYLLLFQDNLELRPGGGKISSYGVLTINKGKIISLKIYDAEEFDKDVNSRVEPPFPIRRYVPSINWHLKDSNFDVDFPSGAITSSILLSKEKRQIDGVAGVDIFFLKNLLNVTGPVRVGGVTVSSANLFEAVFENSENNNNFLIELYKSTGQKISNDNISYRKLIAVFSNSIFEKHLVFTFNKANEQSAFSVNGWASSLPASINSEKTVNDFLGLNEANLGNNKANYFIQREISQSVSIGQDGKISEDLVIKFKNKAANKNLTYKNYLRLILPLGSEIESVKINEQNQKVIEAVTDPSVYENDKFIAQNGLEVEKYNQSGNTIYGFLLTLNPNETKNIEIEYTLLQKIDFLNGGLYSLKIFKQPGIENFPYQFLINIPSNTAITKYSKGFSLTGNGGKASLVIRKDEVFNLNLALR